MTKTRVIQSCYTDKIGGGGGGGGGGTKRSKLRRIGVFEEDEQGLEVQVS